MVFVKRKSYMYTHPQLRSKIQPIHRNNSTFSVTLQKEKKYFEIAAQRK